tara:strand:- start:213 stop:755 length:543 start_codon:yes stop_codon:yes gene_type:complete
MDTDKYISIFLKKQMQNDLFNNLTKEFESQGGPGLNDFINKRIHFHTEENNDFELTKEDILEQVFHNFEDKERDIFTKKKQLLNNPNVYENHILNYIQLYKNKKINIITDMDTLTFEDTFRRTYNLVFHDDAEWGTNKWKQHKKNLKKKVIDRINNPELNKDYQVILFNYIMDLHNKNIN